MMTMAFDLDFKQDLLENDATFATCFQCGTCTGACPVARSTKGSFNPRMIIEASILGLKERLLESQAPNPWLCVTCHACVELCPQDVNLVETFSNIKNKASRRGKLPRGYLDQITSIYKHGVALPINPAIARRRKQLGLVPEPRVAEASVVRSILDRQGVDAMLEVSRPGGGADR